MKKDLKNYNGDDRIVNSRDYFKAVEDLPPEKRYMFGIRSIDELTEGFTNGDLIVVSGYTGYGKTSFCQTVAYNMAQENIPTLWFSYELSARQFFNKYKGKTVPLFYMPKMNKPYDLDWIDERIEECQQKHGVKVVFIDHLHYIVNMGANERKMNELVGETMRQLKLMATSKNVVIILMAHTKQPKDTLSPTIADLRDSSFVGQESDAVYIMHRPTKRGNREEFEDYGTFTVVKQRHTGVIGKNVKLRMQNKMFYDEINLDDEKAL